MPDIVWPPGGRRWPMHLQPALVDKPPAMPYWPIAYMSGDTAYGWIRGVTEPQPLPIWLMGQRLLRRRSQ